MKSQSHNVNDLFEPDGFHIGRVMALQPHLQPLELSQDVMGTEDPRIIGYLTNVLRVWSQSRHDLPHTFADELEITGIVRQPLALIVAEVQHVHRKVAAVDEPYAGGRINDSAWSTNDRFEMQPVDPTVFPSSEQNESLDLAGRESVSTCSECGGAGQSICTRCGGLGTLNCETCGGTRRRMCPRCGGGGTHMGVSGRYINCQLCRGRSTIQCDECNKGQVPCSQCIGGQITCGRCEGHGQQKRRWVLQSRISTLQHRRVNLREPWPLEVGTLHSDMEEVASREWPWPTESPPTAPFNGELPSDITVAAEDAIGSSLGQEPVVDRKGHRITGLRVRVLGTYVYCVDFAFRDRNERAYICGSTNRVFTQRKRIAEPSFFGKVKKLGLRLYDKAFVTGGVEIDRGYLTAVREARAHIADPKCVVPAVAQLLKVAAVVTDSGYQLDIPLSEPTGNMTHVSLLIDLEVDPEKRPIIYTHFVLGAAHRDRFPQVLVLNATLSVGRIAVVDVPGTGRQVFEYIDCRLYELARAQHLATIMRAVSSEIARLITQRALH